MIFEIAKRKSAGFTLLELMLALGILAILISIAAGYLREQTKLTTSIDIRQKNFNEARTAMQYVTEELKNVSNMGEIHAVDELRVLFTGEDAQGIISFETINNKPVAALISDLGEQPYTYSPGDDPSEDIQYDYHIYYDSSSKELRLGETGEVVARNITEFDIKSPEFSPFSIEYDDKQLAAVNVFEIFIQAGEDPYEYELRAYFAAKRQPEV
jgi:prepilin-type N-terminal cleavage/methylation domain-containing protein